MGDLFASGLVVMSTVLASFAMILFKKVSQKDIKKAVTDAKFIVAGLLFVSGAALVIVALKFDELSFLFPFTALTYVWVSVLSRVILKERINKWKIMSVVFIVAGIALTNF